MTCTWSEIGFYISNDIHAPLNISQKPSEDVPRKREIKEFREINDVEILWD